MNSPVRTGVVLVLGMILALRLGAEFMSPEEVPVDRLIKSAEAALAKAPNSIDGHYTLARVHYLAFVRGIETVPAFPTPSRGVGPAPEWMDRRWIEDPRKPEMTQSVEERARHASIALQEFRNVARLDPSHALNFLGQASLVEQVQNWIVTENPYAISDDLKKLSYADARVLYLKAYRLAFASDAKRSTLPLEGVRGIVSHEAALGFLRLLKTATAHVSPEEESARVELEAGLKRLEKIPFGAITPIIFSLQESSSLTELLAMELSTDFRLRGYGPDEKWPWVKASTGFLVWDPAKRGHIVSGQELFGSYTFQIFRANGYDALAALDDDGDGVLRGRELAGIRVWFDANGDGRSAPDEVRDLEELGIVAIDTRADGADGISPTNPRGILLRDGRWLRTWDWIVSPLSR